MPSPDEKLLLLDRKGRVYLTLDKNGKFAIPEAGKFPELFRHRKS